MWNPIGSFIMMALILALPVPSADAQTPDCLLKQGLGDYVGALDCYRKLAARGDASAQYSIGYMYQQGEGVKKNYAEAFAWSYRQKLVTA